MGDPAIYACDMLEDGDILQDIKDEYQRVNRVMRDKGMIELSFVQLSYQHIGAALAVYKAAVNTFCFKMLLQKVNYSVDLLDFMGACLHIHQVFPK